MKELLTIVVNYTSVLRLPKLCKVFIQDPWYVSHLTEVYAAWGAGKRGSIMITMKKTT